MKQYVYTSDSAEVRHISEADSRFVPLIERIDRIVVPIENDYFRFLSHTIVSQQLSSRVAAIIIDRLTTFMKDDMTPKRMLEARFEDLRQLGLSSPKIDYLKSLAQSVLACEIELDRLPTLSDENVIETLTKVRGIGRWTAEMFLMFSLGRKDVFSVLDLGLRNAVKKVYENDRLTKQEIETISLKWKPYRSVAAHYLWHVWDFESK